MSDEKAQEPQDAVAAMARLQREIAETFDKLEALFDAPPASAFYVIPNPEKLSPNDPVRPLVEKMSETINREVPELWLPSTYTDETNGEPS